MWTSHLWNNFTSSRLWKLYDLWRANNSFNYSHKPSRHERPLYLSSGIPFWLPFYSASWSGSDRNYRGLHHWGPFCHLNASLNLWHSFELGATQLFLWRFHLGARLRLSNRISGFLTKFSNWRQQRPSLVHLSARQRPFCWNIWPSLSWKLSDLGAR